MIIKILIFKYESIFGELDYYYLYNILKYSYG